MNASNIFSFEGLFQEKTEWVNVLQGHIAVLPNASLIIKPNYDRLPILHSVTVCPIRFVKRVSGIMILGSSRSPEQVTIDELELLQLISYLIGMAFRLEDTQTSITSTTQQIYKMNAQLHQLDKLKDDFVSVASHELRTPLTAIRSYAWMALNRSDVIITEKMKRYLGRTLISTERLINLVNDMLNISRIESGHVEILPQQFDMRDLIKDIIIEVEAKAKERGILVSMIDTPLPKVFADPEKVRQIVMNLVGNALKFTPPSGAIAISFFTDGKTVDTAIKDSGVGISPDDLVRLFKKFGRLDNSYISSATSGGTGLGLYICKTLIDLLHGRIWARSEGVGKGSSFDFSLPIATPDVLANAEKYTIKLGGNAKVLEPVVV